MNETHLIDGAMGRPHVNALDIRMHNASLFGDGVYITEGLDGLPVTVVDANTVSVGRGVMLINGARITQEEKIDLTIESGSQGMNRNDLLVATYTYDSANTRCEDVNLEIVTGTPTAGTATDPAIHAGTLLDINNADLVEGVSTVQVPIARIPLTGTTVGAPAILAKKFGTIQDIRDSVSLIDGWYVYGINGVKVAIKEVSATVSISWLYIDSIYGGDMQSAKLPDGVFSAAPACSAAIAQASATCWIAPTTNSIPTKTETQRFRVLSSSKETITLRAMITAVGM